MKRPKGWLAGWRLEAAAAVLGTGTEWGGDGRRREEERIWKEECPSLNFTFFVCVCVFVGLHLLHREVPKVRS